MWLLLAQDLPDPKLLEGDVQEILVWVILAQIALYFATVSYFLLRQKKMEEKYDKLQAKTQKQIARSNRAMEAVAKLPPPKENNGDEEEN